MIHSSHSQVAKIRPSKTLISTVWLIPLIALFVGGYLLIQNISSKGPEITLYMDSAEGIAINNTTIRVLNVEVGRVTNIRLRSDQKGVEITAKLKKDSKQFMREDTQFWIVKPRIDQNGITGLGTLLSGSYIAFSPGSSEKEAHEFEVSDLPPITAIGQTGLRIKLIGKNQKMLNAGSPVLYENYIVGTVETAKFNPANQSVQYSIFIQSPHESLVNASSRFWLDSGINVQLNNNGIQVDSPPLSALLSGAIAFDTPPNHREQTIKKENVFTIHNSRSEIENLPNERTLYYVAFFNDSIRGLNVGAPVQYKGIQIGTVAEIPYFQNNDQQHLFQNGYIPIRLRIDPDRIDQGAQAKDKAYWQKHLQMAFDNGLSATLANDNLVLGSKLIALEEININRAKTKPHQTYGSDLVIASYGGNSLDDLQSKVARLLDKFNALPLDKTVNEFNTSLKSLQNTLKSAQNMLASAHQLMAQSSTQNLPNELNQTLRQLRQTLQGISPQSPIYQDVQSTLQGIDKTLKEIRPVINTLQEKPNALIFNHNQKDPIPQGK